MTDSAPDIQTKSPPMFYESPTTAPRRQKKSTDDIVRAAYGKFGRGKYCRKAVELGLGEKSEPQNINRKKESV